MVKQNLGVGAASIFAIGLLLSGNYNRQVTEESSKRLTDWRFNNDTLFTIPNHQKFTIKKNLMFSIELFFSYGYDKNTHQLLPGSASCYTNGAQIGTEWTTKVVSLTADSSGTKLQYDISGTLVWKLFNTPIVHAHKNYSGIIDVEKKDNSIKQ